MKFRFVLFLILLVLFTILVLQNSQETLINVFVWKFSTALSLLTVTIGVIGVILGIILAKIFDSRKAKAREEKAPSQITSNVKQDNPDITE